MVSCIITAENWVLITWIWNWITNFRTMVPNSSYN